ncbi:solute carrier family 35 member F1-like isoform X2 [Asparagus officinalis]|uniref:solute carrier family 35 member F1-like isoform X2 n=1 Tax=Asparagus officinalis TaxID=4686 RepID=UPI00098DEF90|nr:solute carrier family 35 member F1-like isoform X2 [Asparagus officinalis]
MLKLTSLSFKHLFLLFLQEFLAKNGDRVQLIAMLGLFGAIISAVQISILERKELKSITWTAGAILPFVGFSLGMFLFYSVVPILLKLSGSTMLNLSLLTSDMWAVLIRIFAYHEKVDWMYFLAFIAVAVGLVVYSWGEKDDETIGQVANETEEQAKNKDEEAAAESSGNLNAGDGRGPYFPLASEEH